ncbi:aminotransferase class I/II-fold pyridoxal phosphate-dependent enzyme [Mesorhizobium sp. AR07]|uniref:aminotransferase class I/II-fold pyridoxal phosphate-dependent enzyme n=1 Tax=Mesorhizobium sp. AR07 TaxID=2865838 RepID=UPI002160DDB2|nr:aminotransferase class I/II-fold pyridoxal phosphate-dependent enzyme [Mesorhizobium sp. AR07]UVK41848.1 aminotransferase class I/II-fold pyridoxal phosphate-dependent enzyme [Mesorhizobium sp. AR07]
MEKKMQIVALAPSRRLLGVPGYGKGRAGQAQFFRHRLGSNEAPDGPSLAVRLAAAEAFADAQHYPDLRGETLTAALAERHGVTADMIAVSAGSIVLLDQLIRAWCDPGDEVVAPWRSYEAYPIIIGVSGASLVEVPLDIDHRLCADKLVWAIGPRCRVVLICNPNNPTSTELPPEAIDELIATIPSHVLVVLDEAYADYAANAQTVAESPRGRLERHPNLVVLRTFSKAWGLAGMRVGYCVAATPIIAAIQSVAPPFPLPGPALAAALATLAEPEIVAARVARNAAERTRMSEGLAEAGLPTAKSAANFVWLPVKDRAEALTKHLSTAAIAVRCFAGEGVRITTGTEADTDALLESAAGWRPS